MCSDVILGHSIGHRRLLKKLKIKIKKVLKFKAVCIVLKQIAVATLPRCDGLQLEDDLGLVGVIGVPLVLRGLHHHHLAHGHGDLAGGGHLSPRTVHTVAGTDVVVVVVVFTQVATIKFDASYTHTDNTWLSAKRRKSSQSGVF